MLHSLLINHYGYGLLIILVAAFSYGVAQGAKLVPQIIKERRLGLDMIFQSGGMPSSHSAVVVGITTIIGMMDTIYSVEFGLAITIAAIVMYDARGVRREAGKHAQKLNQLTQTLSATHPTITPTHYNTHVGHSIPQIIGGSIVGVAVAVAIYYIIPLI